MRLERAEAVMFGLAVLAATGVVVGLACAVAALIIRAIA